MKLIAHSKETENNVEIYQTLQEHSRNVAELCGATCRQIGLEKMGLLILH